MSTNLALVFRNEASNELMTDSRRLAEGFGARHTDALRKIAGILAETDENFTRRNFALSEYRDSTGKANKVYEMNRAGFMHIALTFTGRKGNDFRIKVMELFEAMEKELRAQRASFPELPFDPRDILSVLEYTTMAVKEERALRLVADQKTEVMTQRIETKPVEVVTQHGLTSTELLELYPELVTYANAKLNTLYWRFVCQNLQDAGKVTVFLRSFGHLASVKVKSPKHKQYVAVFSKADVEKFLDKLRLEDNHAAK